MTKVVASEGQTGEQDMIAFLRSSVVVRNSFNIVYVSYTAP